MLNVLRDETFTWSIGKWPRVLGSNPKRFSAQIASVLDFDGKLDLDLQVTRGASSKTRWLVRRRNTHYNQVGEGWRWQVLEKRPGRVTFRSNGALLHLAGWRLLFSRLHLGNGLRFRRGLQGVRCTATA
jgi:hypothetical protein